MLCQMQKSNSKLGNGIYSERKNSSIHAGDEANFEGRPEKHGL